MRASLSCINMRVRIELTFFSYKKKKSLFHLSFLETLEISRLILKVWATFYFSCKFISICFLILGIPKQSVCLKGAKI